MKNRISELEQLIHEIEAKAKPIHEKVQRELTGDYNLLPHEEKLTLESLKQDALPLRNELVALKRKSLTNEEKREKRLNMIALCSKYHHEGNNAIEGKYFELYLELMDRVVALLPNQKPLLEIYEYLDSKDFQRVIPENYLNTLEQETALNKIVVEIKGLLKILDNQNIDHMKRSKDRS